jgi:pyruvate carboxylase subunit B
MPKKHVHTMITAFRDGFQSVYGARVLTDDFIPVVEAAAQAGMQHFEAGGGARFQSLYFYCNEDAFDMMDRFRAAAGPGANLQTLARGVNVVGLDSQPRDVIALHAKLFKKHGISTIRNFDALNDVNNLIDSGKAIVDAGLKHEVCVTLMELPPGATGAHDAPFYMKVLRGILDAGIPYDSVCFKDASGTSAPQKVYETIKEARKLLGDKTKIVFHSHETAGTAVLGYRSALDAGADQIDLSLAPVSGGTAQPDVITMWHALRGTEYDLGLDIEKVREVEDLFKEQMKDYFMPPEATKVEPLIPFFPMPGGALTANTQMLRDNKLMDKYEDIIAAMGEVVQKGGYGTSVTPVSQFYFQQAFNNVMFGPWKKIAEGYGKMVLGYFGKTPVAPDAEVVKLAAEQLEKEPTTELVVDINDRDESKGVGAAKKILVENKLETTDENIFIAAACKEKGIAFLKGEAKLGIRKNVAAAPIEAGDGGVYGVKVEGKTYNVKIDGPGKATVNGRSYDYAIGAGEEKAPASISGEETEVLKAPLAGLVLRIPVKVGDVLDDGQEAIVLESMKMENPLTVPKGGRVTKILVEQGQQVSEHQALMELEA